MSTHISRKDFIKMTSAGLSASLLPILSSTQLESESGLKQVIAAWPFISNGPKWKPEEFLKHVHSLGIAGVELFPVEHWHLLKKYGLICAATKSHTFIRGMNNRNHHSECLEILNRAIHDTSLAGFPNVMTFTGMSNTSQEKNGTIVSPEEGMKNCIEGYKKIVGIAERQNVTLILEPLNSKVATAMKGHPGYQGDHIDYCLEIIKAVNSPSLKLLFDVYHIQIMDGDIINNITKNIEYIGHVQVAGVPGRGEIDETQEINYLAVMKALLKNGYSGYVGHEWIPTKDAFEGLSKAVKLCDV